MKKDTASGREHKGAGSYEASDVKNLQFPESIRAKPSLYVGALGNDALFHLFKEAAENVIDEALAGHCNFCDIVFGKDGSVTVFDDGRGIPFGKTKIADQLRGGHVEIPTLKAVVSFVHTSGKFTSDSYAVARGCFTGDVQIRLLSGKVVTFKQLYDRWSHDQTPIPVMSFNRKTQKLQPSVISHVQLTMRTRNLVKVFFGDHSVTCTPDHPFFVNRGGSIAKVQAEHLNCGDSLVSTYYSEDRDGYLSQTEQGKKVRVHKFVASWVFGDAEDYEDVHHRNRNRQDNRPTNLELVSRADHAREHAVERAEFGRRKIYEEQATLRKENSERLAETNADPDFIRDSWRTKAVRVAARAIRVYGKLTASTYKEVQRASEQGYVKAVSRFSGNKRELEAQARIHLNVLESRVGYSSNAEDDLAGMHEAGVSSEDFSRRANWAKSVKGWTGVLLGMEDPIGATPHEFNFFNKKGVVVFGRYAQLRRYTSLRALKAHVLHGEALTLFEDLSDAAQRERMVRAEVSMRAPQARMKMASYFLAACQRVRGTLSEDSYETVRPKTAPTWDVGLRVLECLHGEDYDLKSLVASFNHTVKGITHIKKVNAVPVYDVTVDDTHTFFIEPGVLVSNTHGLGIKCNNALSLSFEAWTRHARNPDKWEYVRYAKGIEKAYKTGKIAGMPVNPRTGALPTRGTVVRWLPDSKLLGAEKISLAEVANWLTMAAYFTQGFSLTAFLPNGKSKTFISKNGFHDYLADRLAKLKCETLSPQVFSYQDSLVDCVFQFTNVDSCELQAFTNGLNNPDKGLHFNAVFAALYQALTPFVKKRQEFSIAELREGVVGLVNLKLSAPKFSSQTKDKLVDERAGKPLQDILLKAFEEFFSKHKKLATAVCDRAFDLKALKSQFKASKATLTKLKKSAAAGLPINAATAPHCPPEKRELYIVEGESAAGCFVSGTLIRLADGTVKPIEEITEGTEVLAWHEDDARPAIDRVSAAFNPSDENGVEIRYTTLTKVIFADGTHVVCTPDHLFLTMVGWIPANEMWWEPSVVSATNLGDCPWRRDKILSVDTVTFETPQRVWDLRNLTGYPNFALGNGTVVHNSAKEARDQRFQEILPLRGKVLNVVKQNKGKGDEALTSQQVMNVLNMIGFDPSKKDPLAKLRVGKIIAMSDPDPDGPLVASTRFFAKYESDADWKVVTMEEAFNRRDEQFKVISWAGTVFKTASASFVFEDTVEELVGIKLLGRTFMCTVGHKWPVFKNGELAMVPAGDLKAGVPILRHAFINRQQPLRMAGNTVPAAVAISSVKRHTVAPTWVGCINVPTSHNFMLENGVMTGNCHINTLQMGVYYKYLPQLFERGMIYVVNSPEYYEMVGGEAVTGATPEEVQKKLDKLKAKGRPHHIKGWGEVSPDVLEKLAFDPATRTLLKIEKVTAEQGKKFFELMGTSVEARKALLGIE